MIKKYLICSFLILVILTQIKAYQDPYRLTIRELQIHRIAYYRPIEKRYMAIVCRNTLNYWAKNQHNKNKAKKFKFLVLIYPEVDVTVRWPKKGKVRLKDKYSPRQLKALLYKIKRTAEFTKRLYYYYSYGKLLMTFDFKVLKTKINHIKTSFFRSDYHNRKLRLSYDPILETAAPTPGKVYYETINKYDGYINIFAFPFINATASSGGLRNIMLVPKKLYSRVRRFFVILAARYYQDKLDFWFHEIFHGIQSIYGLYPAHGFMRAYKSRWPSWYKGQGEFYYFQELFRRKVIPRGIERMILRTNKCRVSKELFNKKFTQYQRHQN